MNIKKYFNEKHLLDYFIALFTLFAAIATSCAAYYTYEQWIVSKDIERRQLRAYMSMGSHHEKKIIAGAPPVVNLTIKNAGQTPAYDVSECEFLEIRSINSEIKSEEFKYCAKNIIESDGSLGPGLDEIIVRTSKSPVLTQKDFDEISPNSNKRVFVWGTIYYKDVFNERHYQNFCIIVDNIIGDSQVLHCSHGNDGN